MSTIIISLGWHSAEHGQPWLEFYKMGESWDQLHHGTTTVKEFAQYLVDYEGRGICEVPASRFEVDPNTYRAHLLREDGVPLDPNFEATNARNLFFDMAVSRIVRQRP